jgi:methionyl-tRNA formyltransferase
MEKSGAATAVVFAYHDVGARCLRVLLDAGVQVALVVTHRDDPKENLWFARVSDLSRNLSLQTLEDPSGADLESRLKAIRPDFIFSFYYRRMLPPGVLAAARKGAFNMHGSLLPKYRGRAPVNWAILKGERETGATLHEMVEKPDAGRIVDQQAVPIGPDETAVEVFRKVTDAAEAVLKRNIRGMMAGNIPLRSNDLSKGSYFGGRRPEDGRIDWSRPAKEIHDLVRAVAPPYPGAFTDRMRVLRTAMTERHSSGKPFGPYRENGEWFAACGDGKVLRLLEIEEKAE